jgi:serine/threonine protein kinase
MLPQSASSIRAPVPAERIIPFFRQLLRALHSLHSIGVWHEDLKPANILMTETGMPVLADFGLTTFSPRLKRACSGGGTLDYMSPEKIEVGVWAHARQYERPLIVAHARYHPHRTDLTMVPPRTSTLAASSCTNGSRTITRSSGIEPMIRTR